MPSEPLHEYVHSNKALLAVARDDDALFLCAYIAKEGYISTSKLRNAFDDSSGSLQRVMSKLAKPGFIAHRSEYIFHGWVVSDAGLALLRIMDVFTRGPVSEVSVGIREDVTNTLAAQRRYCENAPDDDLVFEVLRLLPEHEHERFGYVICTQPIDPIKLASLLAPTAIEVERLLPASLDEINATNSETEKFVEQPR